MTIKKAASEHGDEVSTDNGAARAKKSSGRRSSTAKNPDEWQRSYTVVLQNIDDYENLSQLQGEHQNSGPQHGDGIQLHPYSHARTRAHSHLGLRPAAKSVMAIRKVVGNEWRWHKHLNKQEMTLKLDRTDRMTLMWNEFPGVLKEGKCKLINFPFVQALREGADNPEPRSDTALNSADQCILKTMIKALVEKYGDDIEELRDVSGAGLVHNLAIANSDESIALLMELFHLRPTLLKGVHREGRNDFKGVFDGESTLHILAVNKRDVEFLDLLILAKREFSDEEFVKLLMEKWCARTSDVSLPRASCHPLTTVVVYCTSHALWRPTVQ